MDKNDFTKLPLGIALGVLWDAHQNKDNLATMPAPQIPRPPKYDSAIHRKDGVQWASETDIEGLRYWRDQKKQPPRDPQYTEKNAKQAKALEYWIAYRIADPYTPWTGERNRETVTAKPPSGKPTVYPREDRGQNSTRAAPKAEPRFDDDYGDNPVPAGTAGGFDDDIPFYPIEDVG